MSSAYGEIARILAGARRREGRIVLLTALGLGAAAALLALLLGAAALSRGWVPAAAARQGSLSAASLALVAAATWAGVVLLRRSSTAEATARFLARDRPALRSDLVSAVELHEARDGLAAAGYSVALADAHVERSAGLAAAVDLDAVLPDTPARRAGLAAGGALVATLLALAAGGKPLAAAYARLAGLGPPPPVVQPDPITGDVELTFLYPAHTGRPSRTISGTGGEITAPRGTEVRIRARSDRPVEQAEILVEGAGPLAVALEVKDGRQLSGRLTVDQPGDYRFRFRKGKRVVAVGPPIAIAVEPDAFPEVRITAPAPEVEVDARARVRVDWTASDDYGLTELALVTKVPGGAEERKVLHGFDGARRESGSFELDPAAFRLSEGEKLLYWLEVRDNDAVSGPKRGVSATQAVKIYSEAEHRRKLLTQAQALWERMVALLADRLELRDGLSLWTPPLLARGQALDVRTRGLHLSLRDAAVAMRRQKGTPRAIPDALRNAAAGLRAVEQPLTATRATAVRLLGSLAAGDAFWRRLAGEDAALDRELEKDVLYLEALFDKERAQELVAMAKDLQARRRELASLIERYRESPDEEGRQRILAEIARMKQRMNEMARRMAELAKGIQDEHMNAEALAEAQRGQDALGGLDAVEEALRKGDVEAALKALDAMGSRMQQMMAGLERTAGRPDARTRELMKEMREFQQRLAEVQGRQERLSAETGKLREAYRKKIAGTLEKMKEQAGRMKREARQARQELEAARDELSPRAEEEWNRSHDALQDLEKGLESGDFEAALESVKRAMPSLQRLSVGLEDDAQVAERWPQPPGQKGPMVLRDAARHVQQAVPPSRRVRDELEKLFPDPKGVLSGGERKRMEEMANAQGELEREAGQLRQKLDQLAQQAPVFPPQSQATLGEAQGAMGQATGDLREGNPQRGHGRQKQALDALDRFQKGLEEMAKRGGGKGGGEGFPFPMALGGAEGSEGEDGDLSHEKVEIPGADAYKVPEEFRKDILEAMKQRAPEPYKPELQRYYEELVK